jgi:stringent starvation protein B
MEPTLTSRRRVAALVAVLAGLGVFAGVVHHVRIPVSTVLGIYARETGEGMVFSEQDLGPEPPTKPVPPEDGNRRPQLKVVK